MGVVLAVNGDSKEGRNMSNDCALNLSQKCCFTTLYSLFEFICILFTFVVLNCLIVHFYWWNSSDPKGKFSFYAFIINNKVLLFVFR